MSKPDGRRERCEAFITDTPGASPYILEPLLRFVEAECEREFKEHSCEEPIQ